MRYTPYTARKAPSSTRPSSMVRTLSFWLVQGLTVSEHTITSGTNQDAGNITIDYCLIEGFPQYGFRIRNTTDVTVQRCVIRDTTQTPGHDSTGVQVGSNRADPVTGIKILDNEIYNVGDGIQVTDVQGGWRCSPFEVLIEGNDIYLEPSRYDNEHDVGRERHRHQGRVGPTPSRRSFGTTACGACRRSGPGDARASSSSSQMYSRNVLVEDNIMGDAPRGMKDENSASGHRRQYEGRGVGEYEDGGASGEYEDGGAAGFGGQGADPRDG